MAKNVLNFLSEETFVEEAQRARARRSCHGLELEMDQFYKRLWEG